MNRYSKAYSGSSLLVAAAVLVLLLAGNGCGNKKEQSTVSPRPATSPVASAEKTSFNQVTAQLDAGGSLYAYLSTSQWLEGLSDRVNGWREAALSLPDLGDDGRVQVTKAFDLVTRLIKSSGVESITGVGVSGIALEKGFYQTKFVVHRDTNSALGGIWTVFGRAPRPLHELDWLPADTVWAGFAECDLGAIWSAVGNEVRQSGFSEAEEGLKRLNDTIEQASGKKLDELIGSFGGGAGAFFTLKDANKVQIPLPTGATLDVPEPGLVIIFKVKDDSLFNWIDRTLQENPQIIRSDEGELRMRTMPVPLPLPMTLRPTIARQGDHLFVASNDELVRNMMAVKAGKLPGLKAAEEFKRLAQGMPVDGNSFTFISQRLGDVLQKVQAAILSQAGGLGSEAPTALLQKIYSINQPASSFVVSRRLADGWFTVGHGTQQPANAVILPLVVVPVAMVAGLTLPALAKAKSRAQSISCVNNLRQMGLAARIYATDNNGSFPRDFLSMTNELVSPHVLICPADPNNAGRATLTWPTFDPSRTSYEYVTRGLTESTPGLEKKVLFRCRIHGSECMADGSVARKNAR